MTHLSLKETLSLCFFSYSICPVGWCYSLGIVLLFNNEFNKLIWSLNMSITLWIKPLDPPCYLENECIYSQMEIFRLWTVLLTSEILFQPAFLLFDSHTVFLPNHASFFICKYDIKKSILEFRQQRLEKFLKFNFQIRSVIPIRNPCRHFILFFFHFFFFPPFF